MADLQRELDRRFDVTPEVRAELRAGLVPEALQARMRKGYGCLQFIAALFGAAAGAFFAWNVRPVVALGAPLSAFAAGGALLGALLAVVVFRKRFRTMALERPLHVEVAVLRREELAGGKVVLVTDDGRSVGLPPSMKDLALPPGRYRLFALELGGPPQTGPALHAVALEPE